MRKSTALTATGMTVACGALVTLYFASVFYQWADMWPRYLRSREEIAVLGLPMVIVAVWFWPAIVMLDDRGITASYFVRPTRRILYSEVRNICRKSDKEFLICGRGRTREITLSVEHAEASKVEQELRQRGAPWYKGQDVFIGRLIYESLDDHLDAPP